MTDRDQESENKKKSEKTTEEHLPDKGSQRRKFVAAAGGSLLVATGLPSHAQSNQPVLSLTDSDRAKAAIARAGFGADLFPGMIDFTDAAQRLFEDEELAKKVVLVSEATGRVRVGNVSVPLDSPEGLLLVALGDPSVRRAAERESPKAFVAAMDRAGILQKADDATAIGNLARTVRKAISRRDNARLNRFVFGTRPQADESWTWADVTVHVEAQVEVGIEVVAIAIAAIVALIKAPDFPNTNTPALPTLIASALGGRRFSAEVNAEAMLRIEQQVIAALDTGSAVDELKLSPRDRRRAEALARGVTQAVFGSDGRNVRRL